MNSLLSISLCCYILLLITRSLLVLPSQYILTCGLQGRGVRDKHKNCIANELHMFSILAMSASRIEYLDQKSSRRLCFLYRAMIALQTYLKGSSHIDGYLAYDANCGSLPLELFEACCCTLGLSTLLLSWSAAVGN